MGKDIREFSRRCGIIGRRTGLVLAFVLASAMVTAGCAPTVAEQYSDFLADGDIQNRFEICFSDIENGHAGPYTEGEIRALVKDLEEGYLTEDADAHVATELFQEAARTLLRALSGASPSESPEYAEARRLFDEAWRISAVVRRGAYDA